MRAAVAGALGLAAVLAGPAAAGAQTGPRPASTWPTFAWEALAGAGPAAPFEEPARAGSLEPPLLSLALPGAGQHVLGQRRKWAYLALEVAAWTFWVERRARGAHSRDRYRDLAWEQGRIRGPTRVDGDFAYYETLAKWTRSGAFDADPSAPGVQPEPDPATYNGMIWALAAEIHGLEGTVPPTDPRYQAALAYYGARAYGPELLWDWSAAPGAQQELARLIERSDDRFRQATTALGVVIANHLLAAGDAWLSSRGRAAPAHLRVVPAHARLPGPLLVVSIPFGGS